ncbi:spermidine synthase [Methylocella silvestris]|uniref:Spermidine synthase n=1 Tax=Methylocella silvestris TaxID=199596 RepID=A0A2J7TD29_METSI|nr:fused MFS/spermidine synthase [Methylocella silvestris]PNG24676.1 hypothetical protein CR492_17270 [Methylocella silvestris]
MAIATRDIPAAIQRQPVAGAALLLAFVVALFASAFLLFSVQPMVSRMLLPRLGGSPAVWNTCVCFFQATLLLGYCYAHWLAEWRRPRGQVALHALVLAGALVFLPLSLGVDAPPAGAQPADWLLARLMLAVGAPFVAIAATAPLLQHWFSRTTHPRAHDPYFLYVASNAGSLLALLGYPVLIETTLGLSGQAQLWSFGFAATAAAVLACGVVASRRATPLADQADPQTDAAAGMTVQEGLRWIILAFVPSALMLAVTTYITTDIAATPLFWVAPLTIYILTFMLAFSRRPLIGLRALLPLQGIALAAAALAGLNGTPAAAGLILSLVVFALTSAVCHTELAQRRPDAPRLTSYFLLISIGGALGGSFSALLAPALFRGPFEYPLLLIAACLLRPPPPRLPTEARENWAIRGDLLLPVVLMGVAVALLWAESPAGPEFLRPAARIAAVAVPAAALLWFTGRRVRLAMALAGCLLFPMFVDASGALTTTRNFFGVHRVRRVPSEDLIVLQHGTTVHGMQGTRPGEEFTPLGYYDTAGPFGRMFAALARRGAPIAAVGVLGLGIGGLGCYAHPGEAWTFREIDPEVERLARDQRWFHVMAGCGNRPAVVLGDARLTLAADANVKYDLLVIDAFSSDSIPMHLITREALALYLSRLTPNGIVLFHVSNRYLDLTPVVARLAADAGAPARHLLAPPMGAGLRRIGAEVVAVAAPGGNLDFLGDSWDTPKPGSALWTDERSNILGVMRWR